MEFLADLPPEVLKPMSDRSNLLSEIQEGVALKPVPNTFYGPEPFDMKSSGDCILQSSGEIKTQFKVHRLLLSLASPVFADMFNIPQSPTASDTEEPPVIGLSETFRVLHVILQLVHPATNPKIENLDLAFDLVTAFDKYMMDVNILQPFLAPCFQLGDSPTESRCIDAYALAWRLGLADETKKASRYLHSVDLTIPSVQSSIITRSQDINALISLWDLRHRRHLAMDAFMEAAPLSTFRCTAHEGITAAQLTTLRDRAREALSKPFPKGEDVLETMDVPSVLPIPSTAGRGVAAQFGGFKNDSHLSTSQCTNCRNCINVLTPTVSQKRIHDIQGAVNAFPHTVKG